MVLTTLANQTKPVKTEAEIAREDAEAKFQAEKAQCKIDGGTWDVQTGTCIFKPKEELEQPIAPLPGPEIIRNQETGDVSGITLQDGTKFLGIPKEQIDVMAGKSAAAKQLPLGAQEAGTAQALAEETRRKLALAENVGVIDFATAQQMEDQGIDYSQAIAAGLHKGGRTAAGYAATAATAGLVAGPAAPVTVPTAGAIGAGVGGVKGFFEGVADNIKAQRQDLVSVKTKELKKRKTAMNNYIQAANANPAGAEDFLIAYNIEKTLVLRDMNTLVKGGNKDLNFWGTDATPQIVEYEIFIESVQPSLDVRMEQAILKPDPTRAYLPIGAEE